MASSVRLDGLADPLPVDATERDPRLRVGGDHAEHRLVVLGSRSVEDLHERQLADVRARARGLFDVVTVGLRWLVRDNVYRFWMTEQYPPFVWA